ncbi:MAG: UDP-N-acetylmuramoyl-L-alanine--D-glutamate ligase [Chloroflexota bacterium]
MSGADQFADKRVVILGLARQGVALVRFLSSCGAEVIVSDIRSSDKLQSEIAAIEHLQSSGREIELVLGEHPNSLLDNCDLLCLSGGVPPQIEIVQEAIQRGIPLSNDSLLTLQQLRRQRLGPIVAITGSNGKTTTTTLVGEMLKTSGLRVHVGGNIGQPIIDRLHEIQPGEPIVIELSSFQLELFDPEIALGPFESVGPDVAAILNVTPNHLDRHGAMADYAKAKLNLLHQMPEGSSVVVSADDPVTSSLLDNPVGDQKSSIPKAWKLSSLLTQTRERCREQKLEIIPFGRTTSMEYVGVNHEGARIDNCAETCVNTQAPQFPSSSSWLKAGQLTLDNRLLCHQDELLLRGEHNISNVLAAATISQMAGATLEGLQQVATSFRGVAHRLEVISQNNGVLWVNDSIATSPERVVACLRSVDAEKQTVILLAGGQDKKLPWESLADEVLFRVRYLIGFGAYGAEFVSLVQERSRLAKCSAPSSATAKKLDGAVTLAARLVESEKSSCPNCEIVVLLSPGGTSYDAYRDFEERGEHFRQLVQMLTAIPTS